MTNIRINPHTGITIENIGDVLFGQEAAAVERTLGKPTIRHLSYLKDGLLLFYNPEYIVFVKNRQPGVVFTGNMEYFYDDLELKICFDDSKKVEFIESSAGFLSNKTRVFVYNTEVFKTAADGLINLLAAKNNGAVFIENGKSSCTYFEIDISVWREMNEADAKEANEDTPRYSYFQTVGAGRNGYYQFLLR